MTAPYMGAGASPYHGAGGELPPKGPPRTVADWVRYLHAAASVPKDSPDYRDAQEAAIFALGRIRHLNTAANVGEQQQLATEKQPAPAQSLGIGLMHGLSLGAGEPIAGLLSALAGNGFGAGAEQYRAGLERSGETNPNLTATGEVMGSVANAALPVGRGIQGGANLAKAIVGRRPGVLGRFFTGALHTDVTPGLALGGIAGFSAGGEDPGDVNARTKTGIASALGGAVLQAGFGGLGALSVPRYRVAAIEKGVQKALGKTVPPETVGQVTEGVIRAELKKLNVPPEMEERAIANWKVTGQLSVKPPEPPVERPGETLTQVAPNGFEVRGPRVTPTGTAKPSFWEQLYGTPVRDLGKGNTLPYYPRGGMAEQSLAPPPAASPPQLAPNQNAAFIEFLKAGVSAGDVPQRVDALEALGVVGPAEKAQLLQMLGTPR